MRIEYLVFNIIVVILPLIANYYYGPGYLPKKKPFLFVLLFASLPFIIWDYIVTDFFWSFNPLYITGVHIGKLPIEEILFFITVPFACLFIWEIMKRKLNTTTYLPSFYPFACIILLPIGIWYYTQGLYYTGVTYSVFSLIVIIDIILKTHLFKSKEFYIFLSLVGLLTLVFNYYLTARPLVLYNDALKTHAYILTIPAEDFIFGIALMSLCIIVYERTRDKTETKPHTHPK